MKKYSKWKYFEKGTSQAQHKYLIKVLSKGYVFRGKYDFGQKLTVTRLSREIRFSSDFC